MVHPCDAIATLHASNGELLYPCNRVSTVAVELNEELKSVYFCESHGAIFEVGMTVEVVGRREISKKAQ